MTSLLALSLAMTLAGPAPTPAPPCAFGRAQALQEGTTLADQLRCYMTGGRKVGVEVVALVAGVALGARAKQIRDDPGNEYVTIYLNRPLGR